ncbi:MAG: dienelactone hydrolase family protein [Nocardioidaceae bacterium]
MPVSEFGSAWPKGVPVQVHGMDADPIFVGEGDVDAARALVDEAEGAELFLDPGNQHYFADSSLPSYDADAAALLARRVLDFLGAIADPARHPGHPAQGQGRRRLSGLRHPHDGLGDLSRDIEISTTTLPILASFVAQDAVLRAGLFLSVSMPVGAGTHER